MKCLKFTLLIIIVFAAISCSSNSEEKLKKQYIEACADGDFDKARQIVTKLEAVDSWKAKSAMQYVNDKEIYYLLAKPSRENDSRIMYLYNTYETSELPNMSDVLEVAVSMDNENLAMKLVNAGLIPSAKAVSGAVDNDMEEFVIMAISSRPKHLSQKRVLNYYIEQNGKDKTTALVLSSASSFSPKELMQIGIGLENVEIVNKAIALYPALINDKDFLEFTRDYPEMLNGMGKHLQTQINDIKRTVPSFHSQSIVSFWDGYYYSNKGTSDSDLAKYKMPSENAAISRYNNELQEIYANALQINRKDIALEAVNAMLPKVEAYSGSGDGEMIHGFKVDGNHYLIYHNYDEINKLKSDLK